MFSYRSILGSAWSTTKQHKKLWIFGFLAFLMSAGGEYQILTKILNDDYGPAVYDKIASGVNSPFTLLSDLYQICILDPSAGLAVIMMLIFLGAFLFGILWVCVKSQIALVKWVKSYTNSKNESKRASVWEEISTKGHGFWQVLGLNVSIRLAITVLFSLLSLPLVFLYFKESGLGILVYSLFFTVFLPLSISLALIVKYSIAGVVLEKQSFVKSVENGWNLFFKNWLVSLEMAILLFLINFFASLAIIFLLSVIFLPIMLTMIMFNLVLPLYIITLGAFLILITTAAILMTFQTASWTLLYLELNNNGAKAKLERVFNKKNKTTGKKKK
jgi:hypothetical protein